MTELIAVLVAAMGALIGAAVQYSFPRLASDRQERREIIETHLLQLQDALESLYYRINNVRDWGGKSVMSDDYFTLTSVYAIGRVLAHESLLVSRGIYAKLHYDEKLKHELKAGLHLINRGLDDQHFLHYHRLQLAEVLVRDGKVLSFTEFLARTGEGAVKPAISAASTAIESASTERLDELRDGANALIKLLEKRTQVPSALSLIVK